jgi:hypothetical protein
MKRHYFIFAILIFFFASNFSWAQSPQGINYQAVVRDNVGNVVVSTNVGMKVSIHQGFPTGTVIYSESFTPTTSNIGLVNLIIGQGTPLVGSFSTIDWSAGPYYCELGLDITGGTTYLSMGTQQFMSVPYALYAENSGNSSGSSFAQSYIFLRKKATPQVIPDNVVLVGTGVNSWDNIDSTNISFNNTTGTVTIQDAGIYSLHVTMSYATLNSGTFATWFNVTSTHHPVWVARTDVQTTTSHRVSTSYIGYFETGATINVGVFHNSGASASVPNNTTSNDECLFNIVRVN